MPRPEKHVFVCTQARPPGHPRGSCTEKGAGEVMDEFRRLFDERGLYGRFQLTATGCLGYCDDGPTVLVYPEGVMYAGVTGKDVTEIITQHLLADSPVERLRISEEAWS